MVRYMDYDYKENLKAFIDSKNMTARVTELILNKLGAFPGASFDTLLSVYLQKKHALYNYNEFFNHLCSWSNQPEYKKNSMFWSELHRDWQKIVENQIVLTTPTYKSIW